MPYITEEIWQRAAPLAGQGGDTVMNQTYPEPRAEESDAASEAAMEWLMALLLGIRRIRGEMNIAPGKPLAVLLEGGTEQDRETLEQTLDYVHRLGRIEAIRWLEPGETAPESAIALVGEMKALIPMSGLIDKAAELARLDKEMQRIAKDLPRLEGKLKDDGFLAKAPAAVVEKERSRLNELTSSLTELRAQRVRIEAL